MSSFMTTPRHLLNELYSSNCLFLAGVRFAPGGIRKGAAGYDVAFIHPKGNEESPVGGGGVLIELVQAPYFYSYRLFYT